MKRIKIILLIIFSVSLLVSCVNKANATKFSAGNYIETSSTAPVQAEKGTEEGNDEYTINSALMTDAHLMNGWVYFLYPMHEIKEFPNLTNERVLFRQRVDGSELTLLSSAQCVELTVLDDTIYFLESDLAYDHKDLYRVNEEDELILIASEVSMFQIVKPYIYFTYNNTGMGVGIQGHSLYRMNVDGTNSIIAAYGVRALGFGNCIHSFSLENNFVYVDGGSKNADIKIQLGNPADGTEPVVLVEEINKDYASLYADGYIYYGTNKLVKATLDGSEQYILDESSDDSDGYGWVIIEHIDTEYIYYQAGYTYYKIRKDGSEKQEIMEADIISLPPN